MVAELWPSIRWTTFTSAPLAIVRLAAVYGCRSGTPIALAAALNAVRKVLTRVTIPVRSRSA